MDDKQGRPGMTVARMRDWLRDWVIRTTGLAPEEVTPERPMEEFGLSSRDIVILSGELEGLLDVRLDATIAYEYPTIAKLAVRLVEGDVDNADDSAYDAFQTGAEAARSRRLRDEKLTDMDIAVVGMAARYPGASDVDEMWDLLVSGRAGTGELPEGRWSEYASDPDIAAQLAECDTRGGYLDDVVGFDNEFFGLSPLEVENMDPQQRILLELTWEALENAHLPASELRGEAVGVFMGSTNNDYAMLMAADPSAAHPYALTGSSPSILSNRISYAFDFRGPSITMDTACSSSLVSIHQAVRALRDGDADAAVAGGVNLLISPHATLSFGRLGVFSQTGAIHAFSEDATGMIRAEGAGVVVLKRLEDAEADGDDVLAVIKGTAVTSDGRSNGLTAPNPDAQVDVLRRAYADAGVRPQEVDYIEAHGTGTILGDPIEASALGTVLGRGRDVANPTLLGSAKTNFGHTEAAAGVAGVIKVVLAMRNDVIPPSLHYAGPNPYIDFDGGRLEVVEDPREWPEYSGRKVAGVSGFGFGGTNAHVVLTSPPAPPPREEVTAPIDAAAARDAGMPALLPVSGLLPSRRRRAAEDLADWLESNPRADLADVARTLATRSRGRSKAVVPATDATSAVDGMRRVAEGKTGPGIVVADAPLAQGPVWIYSGYGSQHRKMGKDLLALSPVFAETLAKCDEIIVDSVGWSLLELIADDERTYDLESAQIGITAIQVAQTDMMRALGAEPAAVVAMSMGEIAAAYAAGGLTLEETMRVACARSHLMGEGESMLAEDEQGGMAMVELSVEELDELLESHPEFAGVEPAVYAAPSMTTVGGPKPAIGALVEHLTGEGKMARPLAVKGAGHTSALDPLLGELWSECSDVEPTPLSVPLFSSVDRGTTYQPGDVVHDADYFVRCTRQSVWFADAVSRACAAGYTTFVEFSPNPVALMPTMATAFAAGLPDAQLIHLLKRKESAGESLAAACATLYAHGHDIDLGALAGAGSFADLPGINWRHQRYWTAARPSSGGRAKLPGSRTTLPGGDVAYAGDAASAPSIHAIIDAAVADAVPGATILAVEESGALPPAGELTTTVSRHPGGAVISVYAVDGATTELLAKAGVATVTAAGAAGTPGTPGAAGAAAASGGTGGIGSVAESTAAGAPAGFGAGARTPAAAGMPTSAGTGDGEPGWSPDSGVPVETHLRTIVGEAMGYDVDDLPLELPLIDLGLDSLMGMRIKNRVEHDFSIPPLQVQALRDASVADVITLVETLVAETHSSDGAEGDASASVTETPATDAGADAAEQGDVAKQGISVPPRDASERMVFGTWATVAGKTGAAAGVGGVTDELPDLDDATATALSERLSERAGATIAVDDVRAATTLADLAETVRPHLEVEVEGNIRVLRARPDGSTTPAVFLFHPAGGSSAVYQPLVRRLPDDAPVYGVERLEGDITDRAAAYIDDIKDRSAGRPVVLGGWSFGGALAYEVAHQLRGTGVDVAQIMLLDTVQPSDKVPDTPEEMHARWDRYADFSKRTYGLDIPVPHDLLDQQGEEALLAMLEQFLATADSSQHGLSGGVLEHQRASFVDNRILDQLDMGRWGDVDAPVVLFRAERMHDGAIELEPRYATIDEDGGWSAIVSDLEIVHLRGDHLAIVDEPEISKVGAWLGDRLQNLDAENRNGQ
ncbi:polyketide synthase Pks13 [uncultured Corynebacterium sp.]|uniref:polyketide synthase Pks13 n=1 Tax=uncultured Corynebacterium sp. TaxID=159447 RepID=UPI0025D674EE|nr:polyketide synthase Pks13 [uncultured Corynebacterium sp.]